MDARLVTLAAVAVIGLVLLARAAPRVLVRPGRARGERDTGRDTGWRLKYGGSQVPLLQEIDPDYRPPSGMLQYYDPASGQTYMRVGDWSQPSTMCAAVTGKQLVDAGVSAGDMEQIHRFDPSVHLAKPAHTPRILKGLLVDRRLPPGWCPRACAPVRVRI